MRNRWLRPTALLFSLVLVAAACGGRDDDDSATETGGDGGADTTAAGGGEGEGEGGGTPEPVPGFDGTTIRLGVITPTSGPAAVIGNPLTAGGQAYFDAVNAEGGVGGQFPVEYDIQDSQFQAGPADAAYEAIKGNVVMFGQLLGTQIITTLLPKLAADNIVAAPASLDSFWVREQQLLPIGGPYQIQAANALSWYVGGGADGEASAEDVICALTRDDAYGEAGFEGLEFAAEEEGAEIAERVTFPANNADFTTQIGQLQGAGCEMVFFIAVPNETAPAMQKAAELGFAPQWIGQSPTWVGAFAVSPLAPYLQANFVLAGEGPEWGDTSNEGMAQMLEDAPDQAPDIYFAFGYAQARAVHQVLEAAVAAGDLSREGIVSAMNSIDELTFDGLFGDYGWGPPEERVPPRASTIFAVDPAVPGGLSAIEVDLVSPAAEAFEFAE